jgi:hypothetical protein
VSEQLDFLGIPSRSHTEAETVSALHGQRGDLLGDTEGFAHRQHVDIRHEAQPGGYRRHRGRGDERLRESRLRLDMASSGRMLRAVIDRNGHVIRQRDPGVAQRLRGAGNLADLIVALVKKTQPVFHPPFPSPA